MKELVYDGRAFLHHSINDEVYQRCYCKDVIMSAEDGREAIAGNNHRNWSHLFSYCEHNGLDGEHQRILQDYQDPRSVRGIPGQTLGLSSDLVQMLIRPPVLLAALEKVAA